MGITIRIRYQDPSASAGRRHVEDGHREVDEREKAESLDLPKYDDNPLWSLASLDRPSPPSAGNVARDAAHGAALDRNDWKGGASMCPSVPRRLACRANGKTNTHGDNPSAESDLLTSIRR